MQLTLITFATREYAGSAERLRHSAVGVGGCDAAVIFAPKDVQAHLEKVFGADGIPAMGHGCWAWKPHLVVKALAGMQQGEWLVWADAGMRVVRALKPVPLSASPAQFVLAAAVPGETVGSRTTASLLREGEAGAPMVNAALLFWKVCPEALALAQEWLLACSNADRIAGPRETHRHDQSLLSLVMHRHGVGLCPRGWTQHDLAAPLALVQHHRLPAPGLPRVAVVTASTGAACLRDCVESVQRQTAAGVTHLVFADGPECWEAVEATVGEYRHKNPVHAHRLPFPTGRRGWNGHRVYAAAPWLLGDAFDWVCFLDEDNVFAPHHVADMLAALAARPGVCWAHSLRRVFDSSGREAPDDCESLGAIPNVLGDVLVDTNCYMLSVALARAVSECWNSPARPQPPALEADRALARRLLLQDHAATGRHSVYYQCGSRPDSVKLDFFKAGNRALDRRPGLEDLYCFHFDADATAAALQMARAPAPPTLEQCLQEWNPSLLRCVHGRYNLVDGYVAVRVSSIPRNATVLVSMCHPDSAPLALLAMRSDLRRILWTAESPNIRHSSQWEAGFIKKHFDVSISYWQPLLQADDIPTVFCPHNTHQLPPELVAAVAARALVPDPARKGVGMVLENRPTMPVAYVIDGKQLKCLDFLRPRIVNSLPRATVCGVGWDRACAVHSGITVSSAVHRSQDPKTAVDRLRAFDVALIVENCDGAGYLSEKMIDCLIAGCVPAWMGGSPPPQLQPVLEGMFIDLREISLSNLARELEVQVPQVRARMREPGRLEAVLRAVGCGAFARALDAAVAAAKNIKSCH